MTFLSYRYLQFLFEFTEDYITITDFQYQRRYRMRFTGSEESPFMYELVEILPYPTMR